MQSVKACDHFDLIKHSLHGQNAGYVTVQVSNNNQHNLSMIRKRIVEGEMCLLTDSERWSMAFELARAIRQASWLG